MQQPQGLVNIRSRLKSLLKYLLTGLVVALAISRVYPGFAHCLKNNNCNLVFTVLNVVVFWTSVVFWPLVVVGIALGKLTSMLVGLVA